MYSLSRLLQADLRTASAIVSHSYLWTSTARWAPDPALAQHPRCHGVGRKGPAGCDSRSFTKQPRETFTSCLSSKERNLGAATCPGKQASLTPPNKEKMPSAPSFNDGTDRRDAGVQHGLAPPPLYITSTAHGGNACNARHMSRSRLEAMPGRD